MKDEIVKKRVKKILQCKECKRNYQPLLKGIKFEKLSERQAELALYDVTLKYFIFKSEILEEKVV